MRDEDGKRIIENYLLEVGRNLPQQVAREIIPELRSHLIEEATENDEVTAQGARRAVSRMGDPKSIAQEYVEEFRSQYEGETGEERTAYPRGREARQRRDFADRWLRSRHYHHARFYVSPSVLRWILLPVFLSIAGAFSAFLTTSINTGQVASPFILLGGVTGSLVLIAIYYFAKMYVLETLHVVEGTLRTYEGQRVSIDELSDDLGMRRREVKTAITDLRAEGRVKFSFDRLTGDIIVGEEPERPTRTARMKYCSYCGSSLLGDALFCSNCGASVEERSLSAPRPATPQTETTVVSHRSLLHGRRASAAFGLLLITTLVLAGTFIAVGVNVPVRSIDLRESYSVPQATGVKTVNLVVTANSAGVNLGFAHLTDKLVDLNVSATGGLPLFGQAEPSNISSFVALAFNYSEAGDTLTVKSNLSTQPWTWGVSVVCDVLVDYSLRASVNIHAGTGGIVVNTVSGVVLKTLELTTTTGGVDANLVEGVNVEGDINVQVTTGGIDFTWDNVNISKNIGVTLAATTGGIAVSVLQSTPLNGNVTVKATCATGGINFITAIQGNIGATIHASTTTGGTSIKRSIGFSGDPSLLESNNYPAASNLNIDLETTTGGVAIDATRTP